MQFTNKQIAVVAVLNVVILALLAVVFLVPRFASPPDADVPPDGPTDGVQTEPQAHDKYRAASAGLVDGIERETRLMGDGDETVVKAYFHGGFTYIFGNATVKGLDFDEYGGFLCIVDGDGKITSYSYFREKITATCIMAGGYGVAAGNLYYCDYDGNTVLSARTDDEVVGLLVAGSGVAVITQPTSTSLTYTDYSVSGTAWTAGRSTRIDSGYTVKYFDCYDFGDRRVIAARAYSLPRYDSLALYTFEPGGDAAVLYYGGTGENLTTPYAVMPYRDGYFALCAVNGVATVISADYAYTSKHSYSLGFTTDGARAFYCDKKYYACFDRADGPVTYELDDYLSRRRVGELDGLSLDCVVKSDGRIVGYGGVTQKTSSGVSRISVAAVTVGSGGTRAFEILSGTVHAATAEKAPTVVLSARGGAALSAPTELDIYVLKLNGA